MFIRTLTILFLVCLAPGMYGQGNPNIRVGLSLGSTEHIVSLEGGGSICARSGSPILKLREGEMLRIWLDSRNEISYREEYRIQVGPHLSKNESEAVVQKLRALGERPEAVKNSDGDTWRVMMGSFSGPEAAEPLLENLYAEGFEELWVTSEKMAAAPKKSRGGLYGITERFERVALPSDGVLLRQLKETVKIEGKGSYRGRVEIFPNAKNRLTVVNTLDMETYLRGVLPKEMSAWVFPSIEALKAQAVAARTYAYANLGKRSASGFDLLDTPLDQVYGGKDCEQSLADRAVEETKGLIGTLNGRPIQMLYMATGGGATIDNTFVFGGGYPYMKGVSSYPENPNTLTYNGIPVPAGSQGWLTWETARLVAEGLLSHDHLNDSKMQSDFSPSEIRNCMALLTKRLSLPTPGLQAPDGPQIYTWMAKCLDLDKVINGAERPQDTAYFLQDSKAPAHDRLLAGFLTRLGIVSPHQWRAQKVTTLDALSVLGKLWEELEPMELQEGMLLLDGQVRPRGKGPEHLRLASPLLILEEYPGGHLRMVATSAIRVGDRVKWLSQGGGSRLLVRRLDPDGASYDRYNPSAHWKVAMTEKELLAALRSVSAVRSLRSIELKHNENGRVTEMTIRDQAGKPHRFTGMRIRGALGLRDNVFRYIATGEAPNRRFIFYGRGWGHGVGMDQTGAFGMGIDGFTFDRILKHYYKGITIQPVSR